uniref:Uncharacterized protein n=1 Tax=Oryza meridionalis TaxID=40149 RepID=A0A0E0CMP3_9ORYZ
MRRGAERWRVERGTAAGARRPPHSLPHRRLPRCKRASRRVVAVAAEAAASAPKGPRGGAGGQSAATTRTVVTCILTGLPVVLAALGATMYIKKHRRGEAEVALARGGDKVFDKKGSWDLKSFRVLAFDEHEMIDGVRDERFC